MKNYRGFEGEVAEMDGIVNAQGNYDQGRGADGLGYVASRYGISVPVSNRPAAISGKPTPAASLDPNIILPRVLRPGDSRRGSPWTAEIAKRFPTVTVKKVGGPVTLVRRPRARRRPVSKAKTIRHRKQFIEWIKNWAPGLYRRAKAKADATEAAEGGELGNLGGWWESFSDNLTEVGTTYLQFRTQKEILDAQLERMRAGEPPLQTSEYAPTISVKPDPGTTREITGAIGAGLGRMLPFIAIGGVALVLMMRRR